MPWELICPFKKVGQNDGGSKNIENELLLLVGTYEVYNTLFQLHAQLWLFGYWYGWDIHHIISIVAWSLLWV